MIAEHYDDTKKIFHFLFYSFTFFIVLIERV